MDENNKKGWFSRLKDGLRKSTSTLSTGITDIFTKRKLDAGTLEELEDLLISADLGVPLAKRVRDTLARTRMDREVELNEVKAILAEEISKILDPVAKPLTIDSSHHPHVILMVGVNGTGKTTTIGKLAHQLKGEGKSVMLAAADTFRAAAIEQLEIWGQRVAVPVVSASVGSDPASVTFEAMDRAIREKTDVLIIDTAGRLQNRKELMEELAKVVRIIGRKMDGAPHDTILVLDATTGQNALQQVAVFREAAHITGLIMTKLDGSAKGGVLVSCAEQQKLPIHVIGIGEDIEDLKPFKAKDFAMALADVADNSFEKSEGVKTL